MEQDLSGKRTRRAGYQGGPKPRTAARRAAAAAQRRLVVVPTCGPGGWWSAAGAIAARGEMHGQDRVLFLCEKKAS